MNKQVTVAECEFLVHNSPYKGILDSEQSAPLWIVLDKIVTYQRATYVTIAHFLHTLFHPI